MHTHYDWSQIKRRMLIQDQSYFTGYIKSLLSKSELCLQDKLADEQTSETNDWGDLWQLQLSAYKTAANMLRIPRDTWRLPIESIQDMFSKNLEHRQSSGIGVQSITESILNALLLIVLTKKETDSYILDSPKRHSACFFSWIFHIFKCSEFLWTFFELSLEQLLKYKVEEIRGSDMQHSWGKGHQMWHTEEYFQCITFALKNSIFFWFNFQENYCIVEKPRNVRIWWAFLKKTNKKTPGN